MGRVYGICISEKRGTLKHEVSEACFKENWGIEGDAHAGEWHRQVSLLSLEKIEEFRSKGADVDFGAFGENLIVDGFDLKNLPVGTVFRIGDVELELTQTGKECHDHCAIYKAVGDCIMPREGVFTKVLKGGTVHVGDEVTMCPPDKDRPFTAAVITLSDRAFAGTYEDRSGALIEEILKDKGYEVVERLLLPDDRAMLKKELMRLSDRRQLSIVFTTGGTGFSERDITPDVTEEVCDRMAPGISTAMMAKSLNITPMAMLSRQAAGIRKKTLIINLPGKPSACKEDLDIILPALPHGLSILRGDGDA